MKYLCNILLFIFFLSANLLLGQENNVVHLGAAKARLIGKTPPLQSFQSYNILDGSDIRKLSKKHKPGKDFFYQRFPKKKSLNSSIYQGPDQLVSQTNFSYLFDADTLFTIEGIDKIESGADVPDPVGDVGSNQYIQMTNAGNGSRIMIYDKQGNSSIPQSFNSSEIWGSASVMGDPIILYDQYSGRWIFTELGTFDNHKLLIAVTVTDDPLQGFYLYEFVSPYFTDYPKYGIWEDTFVITTNDENSSCIPVFALDKNSLLNGDVEVDYVSFGLPKFATDINETFQVAAPVDWDSKKLPEEESAHGYVMRLYDNVWEHQQGIDYDALELYKVSVDWAFPELAELEGPLLIPTTPFDSYVCNDNLEDCVSQGEGNSTFSALQQTLMHRVQYRNFSQHESIVLNHVVDVNDNGQTGIRWYELRKTEEQDWHVYQEGTLAGEDETNLFMGSIAMDGNRNIALGYNIAGPGKFPSAMITGRRANDPLHVMTMTPIEFAQGENYNTSSRWGDYSSMNIDPVDELTFWYTTEYMDVFSNWKTKIVSYRLEQFPIDLALDQLESPSNGPNLSTENSIVVEVCNRGLDVIYYFNLNYQINGGVPVSQLFDQQLLPDSCQHYTFSTPADLSTIGDYEIKLWSETINDTFYLNDTISCTIINQTVNDAGIVWIKNIGTYTCDSTKTVSCILKNFGQDTLVSADVFIVLNESDTISTSFTGQLAPGDAVDVVVNLTGFLPGENEILAYSQLPNGFSDDDVLNDSFSTNTQWYAGNTSNLRVYFHTDNAPYQNEWHIQSEVGDLLYSSNQFLEEDQTYIQELCLPTDCYQFVLNDKYGNGLTPIGNYTIIDENNDTITSLINPNFGIQEINTFCLTEECTLAGDFQIVPTTIPGASDGSIFVQPMNGVPPYTYSLNNGTFMDNSTFTDLPSGLYMITILDLDSCTFLMNAEVPACNLMSMITVTNATELAEDDGAMFIEMSNGIPPYQISFNGGTYSEENNFENLQSGNYSIDVLDSLGCTYSDSVFIDLLVRIEETTQGYQFLLAPNPSKGLFSLEIRGLSHDPVLPFQIMDVSGRILRHDFIARFNGTYRSNISLTGYPNGVYYLSFNVKGFKELVKVVKL